MSGPAGTQPAAGGPTTPAVTQSGAPAVTQSDAPGVTSGPAVTDATAVDPAGDGPRGRASARGTALASVARRIRRYVVSAPFSCGFTAALWLIGAATGSLTTGPHRELRRVVGFGTSALARGNWFTPVTGALFTPGLSTYVVMTILLLTVCVAVERSIGTGRSIVIFAISQVAGVVVASGLIGLGATAGSGWLHRLASEVTIGPWPGVVGLMVAGAAGLGVVWRRRWRLVALVALATTVLYAGNQTSVLALLGGLAGLAAGAVLIPRTTVAHTPPRTVAERRVLVALLVAASAAGPLSTLITGTRNGPLAVLDFLLLPSAREIDNLHALCSPLGAPGRGCGDLSTAFLVQGIGPLFQTLLPVLVLLVLAEGLRRGRRAAYLATVVVNLGFALLGVALSGRQVSDLLSDAPTHHVPDAQLWITRLAPVVFPLVIAVIVFRYRKLFTVRAPWLAYRQWAIVTGGAAVALGACYVGIGYALRDQFRPMPSIGMLLADLPARLAPVGYLGHGRLHFFPVGTAATELYEWTGAALWTVALVMAIPLFWRSRQAPETPHRAEVAEVLREHGGTSIAYMSLWPGNRYLFTADRSTVIPYRVIAGVAVTTGPPIGPAPQQALDRLVEFCAAAGWIPCLFSVPEQTVALAAQHGFRSLVVASDATIELATLSFTGKRWQDIRTARNRARKDGVTALWSSFPDLAEDLRRQVVTIDHEWLATKGLPEMGFTLGGLAELDDPDVRCVLAVGADGQVLAVTSWLPGYEGGRIVGWTLDFMRRGPGAFPGAMEYLIATALTQFQEEGATWASLSGVPLARPADSPQPRAGIARAMQTMADVLEPVYGFRSLLAFKAKFDPRFTPMYMCYPDPASLPTIANAVLKAYVPHMNPADTLAILRRIARPAATHS